ncbi:DUF262 domain-containing protein [Microbacterium sp. CFBP 13617]|uniref:DUF262 domain-containing protein n=1 Tax=Microbacterium sp. CFBP 13617 TaxID=2774035 RepID=UPI001783412B|nr:DUF262 domain-containing protein [Microbacterium sp. CFBP 13617]MBD8217452.1 DUF262 domain-containing protein [Microbacterium sp. CFBP 13617]
MKIDKSDPELETLISRIRNDELDLQPDFQRGEVWDSKRRQRLVDTVLRGWYVPAVHIVRSDDGDEEVLDGQQRLAGIRDFFDDRVKIDGFIEPRDPKIEALHGLRYSQLPDSVRKAVNRFVVQTITLTAYDPDEPNELFFRLNQAYNLTPPEKRNALRGEARDQVKTLVQELTEDGLLDRPMIGFGNGRLAFDDIVARTCVAIEMGTLSTHINNNVVEDYYRRKDGFSSSTIRAVRDSGRRLVAQIMEASDQGLKIRFNKGTLQTWLIYCDWAPRRFGDLPADLLARFENDRTRLRSGEFDTDTAHLRRALAEVLRQYDDRASYRVTDVSSVLIRDLSLHLFAQVIFNYPAYKSSDHLFGRLTSEPDQTPTLIGEFLEATRWGELGAARSTS